MASYTEAQLDNFCAEMFELQANVSTWEGAWIEEDQATAYGKKSITISWSHNGSGVVTGTVAESFTGDGGGHNAHGVRLWWDGGADFVDIIWGASSYDMTPAATLTVDDVTFTFS